MQIAGSRRSVALLCYAAIAAAFAGWSVWFLADALKAGWTHDDLMNTWRAFVRPWPDLLADIVVFFRPTPVYRPAPMVLYKAWFSLSGPDIFPLRMLLLALIVMNSGLVFLVARSLSGSAAAGGVAALLMVYHPALAHLYYNSGLMFDVLCFTFYWAAFWFYLRFRESGRPWQAMLVLLWHLLALNSKEMAVSLPVAIATWELLSGRRRGGFILAASAAIMSASAIAGRVFAAESVSSYPGYVVHVGLAEYWSHLRTFIDYLLLTPGLLLLAFAFAVAARSRSAIFGLVTFLVGILPVAFIPQRTLEAAYVALPGLAICLADLLGIGAALLGRKLPQPAVAALLIFTVMLVLIGAYRVRPPVEDWQASAWQIERAWKSITQRWPSMPAGTRVLVIEDGFTTEYATTFIIHLAYRDTGITVDRLDKLADRSPATAAAYHIRLRLNNQGVVAAP